MNAMPSVPIDDEDDGLKRQFAEHVLSTVVQAMRCLQTQWDVSTLVTQAASMQEFDALTFRVVKHLMPTTWAQIECLSETFGKDAIPRIYQGRDPRICALFLVLREQHSEHGESDEAFVVQIPRIVTTMQAICRNEERHYNAVMVSLGREGDLQQIAGNVAG